MKNVIVLGPGCTNCKKTFESIQRLITKHEFDAIVTKNSDISALLRYGVISTPAVVIDDKIVFVGGIPCEKEILGWFAEQAACSCGGCCK